MRADEVESDAHERNAAPRRADGYHRYGLGNLTIDQLRRERRDLAASLAFLAAGSAAHAPMRARLDAVDTELDRAQQTGTVDRS